MCEHTSDADVEAIEVIGCSSSPLDRWTPVVGEESLELLGHLGIPEPGTLRVRDEALSVLAKCSPPSERDGGSTGLVLGHVQSGKTMSFTTVSALARDNGFQMVIVITGVSVPLFSQSTNRLQSDLRLQTRPDRRWQHFANPRGTDRNAIRDTLAEWRDPDLADHERRAILVTTMKNVRHLDNLVSVLSDLDLRNVPTLVIDDEADQAGLNTRVRQGEESATYQRLIQLRRSLPQHTFLQYTATPQAPLLINLIDMLSPDFAEVLTPGEDYVGGRDFFLENPDLVEPIPDDEVPRRGHRLHDPPASLLSALRVFFLGVAAGLLNDQGELHSKGV